MFKPKIIINPELIDFCFDGIDKKCFHIEIKDEEYEVCEIASRNYWSNSKTGKYGSGLSSSQEDPFKPVRTGLLGQMAYSKIFNDSIDLNYRKYGDKYDNLIGKYKIDIKCTRRNSGETLIYRVSESGKEIPLDKDIYIGSYLKSEDRENKKANVLLIGFILKEDAEKCELKYGYAGKRHINVVVKADQLKPIDKLLEIKNKFMIGSL